MKKKNKFRNRKVSSPQSLGDRMKENYENITRYKLPKRSYVIIRLDGKAFHTYTRGLNKPFDANFVEDMSNTTKYLLENIQGCKMAYVQSDEISLLLTDFDKLTTSAWFDNNIQKMASVSASMTTMEFNRLRTLRGINTGALFDSRVFTIPQVEEVANYFLWRQRDCIINSVQSVAQSMFSHKELNGLSCEVLKEKMINERDVDWGNYQSVYKNGTLYYKSCNGLLMCCHGNNKYSDWEDIISMKTNID